MRHWRVTCWVCLAVFALFASPIGAQFCIYSTNKCNGGEQCSTDNCRQYFEIDNGVTSYYSYKVWYQDGQAVQRTYNEIGCNDVNGYSDYVVRAFANECFVGTQETSFMFKDKAASAFRIHSTVTTVVALLITAFSLLGP
uniref:Fibronectin type-III domain-containing protein n=1 Tax=Chromera velia CCMP2878 TaxID=1169474 RepID=A0A0G4FV70_9ALVE|mmetsp:Transcript_34230/g.67679  ORF Transcript_34230/g.67679 Transcript_34230/m.67679 type:complete len:140 (-) Transcript_34230:86-505(-)|eukprot:Cvel_18837.t1-p1 / transcript=Cvel_18837.t1 / gene=Cvel_18837 / organism=Chromera_velia_CCMP2878 / gene_product=hypothetical protein / transcript_product=hypothetical protein / location=Cvel_scaffold1583:13358-13774(+) / protein_length=139 / sequence_SO=supercontig / SO=protein_coding / is_pseudo=false